MTRVFVGSKFAVTILLIFFQIQTSVPEATWKSQKRSAEPSVKKTKFTASLIFLHGLGDTGEPWAETMSEIAETHVRIVCPTAPVIPVSLNNGSRMPAWFDIKSLDDVTLEDMNGVQNASHFVHALIDKEVEAGIRANRILVAGFSQGGALALHSTLTYPRKLAAVVAMSCWLPLSTVFTPSQVTANRNVPILLCHGNREAPKPKHSTQVLPNVYQRRLLPRTEVQNKLQLNHSAKIKPTAKVNGADEVDNNEINRLTEVTYVLEDAAANDSLKGECTSCSDEYSSAVNNKWTLPLLRTGDKRYYLGTFFKANWYRASQFCRYHGMQLASVNNQEENDKLEKYVTDFGLGFEHFWTSGTDLAEEGSFFWMSTGRPISFTNWNAGEPNNFKYENGEEEHCLELWNRDGKGLKWNDSPCSFETYFICEG